MKIPNFLGEHQLVDKNGFLTENWKRTFDQLFQELQKNMSDEGHIVPSQSSANIATLTGKVDDGAFLYDDDTHKVKVSINGVFKEIVTA